MKIDNLNEAPDIIQQVYIYQKMNGFVGSALLDKARKEYPEYFEDEFEYERKWAEVPQVFRGMLIANYPYSEFEVIMQQVIF